MKKKHRLWKILSAFSLTILLTGCTTLDYVDDDYQPTRASSVQTAEMFNVQTYEKTSGEQNIRVGISETVLEQALVLYFEVQNNSDVIYKFDSREITATSPIGEISVISPSNYIDAYQNYEASNYAGLANAGAALTPFANIQNQYMQSTQNGQTSMESRKNISPELMAVEENITGIQKHTITSYKLIGPNSSQYFYIFLRKPEEYPIVIKYKDLTYKFGSRKNANK